MEMQHEMEEEIQCNDDDMPMMNMMKMYFHYGLGDLLLFRGLTLDSNLKLCLACLILFIMSIVHEFLNRARTCLGYSTIENSRPNTDSAPAVQTTTSQPPVSNGYGSYGESVGSGKYSRIRLCGLGVCGSPLASSSVLALPGLRKKSCRRILQAVIQFLRTFLSLTIMLAAMSYNICLIFAIALGSAVGSYIFHNGSAELEPLCH